MLPSLPLLALLACGGPVSDPAGEGAPAEAAPAELAAARAAVGPDVVIVTVDTLRADRLGFAGHAGARTPHLDAIAARGRVFDHATTPLPRTTPALSSLHTGLWPKHHGSREVGDPQRVDRTLASELQGRGWSTVAISAMSVASPEQRLDVGFGSFEVLHDAPAPKITEAALAAVKGADPAKPVLLWVHYADPHFPYLPPGDGGGTCRTLGERAAKGRLQRQELFANRGGKAAEILDDCRALYDGEITVVDEAVGQLLDGMEAAGRAEPLVIVSADHGENQGEDGLYYEHGPSLHDASLRVPLVIAGPGVSAGRDAGVARLEDLAPTVLDWVGASVDGLDGTSLAPRLRGGEGGPTVALAESGSALQLGLHGFLVSGRKGRFCVNGVQYAWCERPRLGAALFDHVADPALEKPLTGQHPEEEARLKAAAERWPPETARQLAARTPRFKLVARPSMDGGYDRALYDLSADPDADVSAAHPEVVEELASELEAWAERPLPGAERSDGELEALRSLGYVE